MGKAHHKQPRTTSHDIFRQKPKFEVGERVYYINEKREVKLDNIVRIINHPRFQQKSYIFRNGIERLHIWKYREEAEKNLVY